MAVICRNCKKKIEKDEAVKVPAGKSGTRFIYYCSEECKIDAEQKKQAKKAGYSNESLVYRRIREYIGRMSDDFIQKKLDKLPSGWTEKAVLAYLKENKYRILSIMRKVQFKNASHRGNYFFRIMYQEIQPFIDDEQKTLRKTATKFFTDVPTNERDVDIYKRKGRNGGLAFWIPYAMAKMKEEESQHG